MRRPALPKLPKLPRRGAAKPAPAAAPAEPVKSPAPALIQPVKPRRRRSPLLLAVPGLIIVAVVIVVVISSGPSDDEDVRTTLDHYAQAFRDKDIATICDELLSSQLVENLRTAARPCEVAMKIGTSSVENPTLEVLSVKVKGKTAFARVDTGADNQPPAKATVELVKEGDNWRISALPSEEPASPAP